jgi:hypothetical protein
MIIARYRLFGLSLSITESAALIKTDCGVITAEFMKQLALPLATWLAFVLLFLQKFPNDL